MRSPSAGLQPQALRLAKPTRSTCQDRRPSNEAKHALAHARAKQYRYDNCSYSRSQLALRELRKMHSLGVSLCIPRAKPRPLKFVPQSSSLSLYLRYDDFMCLQCFPAHKQARTAVRSPPSDNQTSTALDRWRGGRGCANCYQSEHKLTLKPIAAQKKT